MLNFNRNKEEVRSELYSLKHKDLDVALVYVNPITGIMEHVLEVYLPDEFPVGCMPDGRYLSAWWSGRAIPESRRGILQVLHRMNETTNQSLMLAGYGLSLTDHYWLLPLGEEAYWNDINYFDNDFSDELGILLTDTGRVDLDRHISKFSPSSSVNGEMKKKWVIRDGIRYLMKMSFHDYGQQAVNEIIACKLHELLGWENYNRYILEQAVLDKKEYPCSLNPLFTSREREAVSAYQLIQNEKGRNDISYYETVICQAVKHGLSETEVRKQSEYTILTDFLLSNTDRHLNNLAFLRNSDNKKFCCAAPIFDTGNSLFFNQEFIPAGEDLLEIPVNSFRKREVDLLQYVTDTSLVDLEKLRGFPDIVYEMLTDYTDMPEERAEKISETVRQKMEYLNQFYNGKKIWKKEKYR